MSCRADKPAVSCAHRRMAVLSGRFQWRSGHGWVWKDAKRPDVCWERCPWCWGTLPDIDEATVRHFEELHNNGWPSDCEPDMEC